MSVFTLHPQLNQDTTLVVETETLVLLLANDARYPWLILVPKVADIKEMYQLSIPAQFDFYQASTLLGKELMDLFKGDKLNVAALGNQVPQLHVHHIVRFETDAAWPSPIWGLGQAETYSQNLLDDRLKLLRSHLSLCA